MNYESNSRTWNMMNHVILSIQGESVAHSGVSVSVRDLVCLLLVLLLLLYSCYNCYRQWKKNYQLPPGDFVGFRGHIYSFFGNKTIYIDGEGSSSLRTAKNFNGCRMPCK